MYVMYARGYNKTNLKIQISFSAVYLYEYVLPMLYLSAAVRIIQQTYKWVSLVASLGCTLENIFLRNFIYF